MTIPLVMVSALPDRFQGIPIRVEYPKGSHRLTRGGLRLMFDHYGEFTGTLGADGDAIDFYMGPNPSSQRVFVVNQQRMDGSDFDEHKVFIGFASARDAMESYQLHYPAVWSKLFRSLRERSVTWLRAWLEQPQARPLTKGGPYVGKRGGLWADPEHKVPFKGKVATHSCPRCKGIGHVAQKQITISGGEETSTSSCKTCNKKGKVALTPQNEKRLRTSFDGKQARLGFMRKAQPFDGGFTTEEAQRAAEALAIDFDKEKFTLAQFREGMNVEREHADVSKAAEVIGKIARAHLREDPRYYAKLATIEKSRTTFDAQAWAEEIVAGWAKLPRVDDNATLMHYPNGRGLFFKAGGTVFTGPKGGKWADAEHTIPWKEGGPARTKKQDDPKKGRQPPQGGFEPRPKKKPGPDQPPEGGFGPKKPGDAKKQPPLKSDMPGFGPKKGAEKPPEKEAAKDTAETKSASNGMADLKQQLKEHRAVAAAKRDAASPKERRGKEMTSDWMTAEEKAKDAQLMSALDRHQDTLAYVANTFGPEGLAAHQTDIAAGDKAAEGVTKSTTELLTELVAADGVDGGPPDAPPDAPDASEKPAEGKVDAEGDELPAKMSDASRTALQKFTQNTMDTIKTVITGSAKVIRAFLSGAVKALGLLGKVATGGKTPAVRSSASKAKSLLARMLEAVLQTLDLLFVEPIRLGASLAGDAVDKMKAGAKAKAKKDSKKGVKAEKKGDKSPKKGKVALKKSDFDLFFKSTKPPAGYSAIPGGSKGGFRKRIGGRWSYWYPDGKSGGTTTDRDTGPESGAMRKVRGAPADAEPIPAFSDSRAKPGSALAELEAGGFPRGTVMVEGEKVTRTVLPGALQMRLIADLEGLTVNAAKRAGAAFKTSRDIDTVHDLRMASLEGLIRAMQSYKGGLPFLPLAKAHAENTARVFAATTRDGVHLPKRQARLLAGFQAAGIQAQQDGQKGDKATAEAWNVRMDQIHDGAGSDPLPMEDYTYAGRKNPGKLSLAREFSAFLSGNNVTAGDSPEEASRFDAAVSNSDGMSEQDKRDLQADFAKVLPKLESIEVELPTGTFRGDGAALLTASLGLKDDAMSARQLADTFTIEKRSAKGDWKPVSDRSARRVMDDFVTQVTERARAIMADPKRAPVAKPTPSVRAEVKKAAEKVTAARAMSWKGSERQKLRAQLKGLKPGSDEHREVAEAIRNVSAMPAEAAKKVIAMRESPIAREMQQLTLGGFAKSLLRVDGELLSLQKATSEAARRMMEQHPEAAKILFRPDAVPSNGYLRAMSLAGFL